MRGSALFSITKIGLMNAHFCDQDWGRALNNGSMYQIDSLGLNSPFFVYCFESFMIN